MSFLSETLRAFSFADLCTGLAGADLVAPPPEDTVVLDLRPRIGIVREEIPWLRQKEACTGRAAGRSLPWRSFQLQMRPRSVVVPEGLAIIVCSHPLVVQKDSCFVKMTMLDYANITIEQSQETTKKSKQENPSWRETFEFGTTVNFRPAGIVPKTDWSLYPASN